MIAPCESAVKYFLPAMKVGIAQELYEEYGFSQVRIARALGLTQAQVSKYLSEDYSHEIGKAIKIRAVGLEAATIARMIAKGKLKGQKISSKVCTVCAKINSRYACAFSAAKKG